MPAGLAKVTHTMTLKRLLRNGLTHDRLKEVFQSSVSFLDFYDKMKDIGKQTYLKQSVKCLQHKHFLFKNIMTHKFKCIIISRFYCNRDILYFFRYRTQSIKITCSSIISNGSRMHWER